MVSKPISVCRRARFAQHWSRQQQQHPHQHQQQPPAVERGVRDLSTQHTRGKCCTETQIAVSVLKHRGGGTHLWTNQFPLPLNQTIGLRSRSIRRCIRRSIPRSIPTSYRPPWPRDVLGMMSLNNSFVGCPRLLRLHSYTLQNHFVKSLILPGYIDSSFLSRRPAEIAWQNCTHSSGTITRRTRPHTCKSCGFPCRLLRTRGNAWRVRTFC